MSPYFAVAGDWQHKYEDAALELKALQRHQAVALNFLKVLHQAHFTVIDSF